MSFPSNRRKEEEGRRGISLERRDRKLGLCAFKIRDTSEIQINEGFVFFLSIDPLEMKMVKC